MRIATIIFAYNRSYHVGKVIEALEKNTIRPEKLFIFQDGLKTELHKSEWIETNKLIRSVEWCDCEVIVSDKNKGLALSIISGLNYVFETYDAVIVLEDDCVPHPMFMDYMVSSLKKYSLVRKVYSVGGYGWPVEVQRNGTDAYFTGRASSWGWGTWKNRWEEYREDYKILSRIKRDEETLKRFHDWGEDLESYLLGNVNGTCDSWAVFWALTVIEKKGYCLAPYESLIDNIGFDGTGVHCGTGMLMKKLRSVNDYTQLTLPDDIVFPDKCEEVFRDYFGWTSNEERLLFYNKVLTLWVKLHQKGITLANYLYERNIKDVYVWGKNYLLDLLILDFGDKIKINSIVESKPTGEDYLGIPIISMEKIKEKDPFIIVIPAYDMERIKNKIKGKISGTIVGIDELMDQPHTMG